MYAAYTALQRNQRTATWPYNLRLAGFGRTPLGARSALVDALGNGWTLTYGEQAVYGTSHILRIYTVLFDRAPRWVQKKKP